MDKERKIVYKDLEYAPRHPELHDEIEAHRFCVIVAHRRFGKTVLAINHLIKQAFHCTFDNGSYAYIAPQRNQAKVIAWDYLKRYTKDIPSVAINESELSIRFINGSIIRLFGADNPDALRGIYFDSVILDEVAQMKPQVWQEIIRPALADRHGSAVFIGTPKGANIFYEMYSHALQEMEAGNSEWYACEYPVTKTKSLKPEEVQALKEELSDNAFKQEMLCDFNASSDDVLIPLPLVEEAMSRSYRDYEYKSAPLVYGIDVARFGDDASVLFKKQGIVAYPPIVYRKLDNMELADRIASEIQREQPMAVFIDAGGGAGVIDRLKQLRFNNVIEVPFGSKPTQPGRFMNRRMEMWQEMHDWIKAGGALPPDELLKAELTTPTYFFNQQGLLQLEKKEDVKERLLRSPDRADALALCFAAPVFMPSRDYQVQRKAKSDVNWSEW